MPQTPQDPQSIRTVSTIPIAVAKPTQAQLARDSPQLDADQFQEFFDTDHIVEDLQTGTITERWLLAGSPTEAQASGALQKYQRGDPHHKHTDHFVVRREFRYHAHSDSDTERLTMMTVTWQRMPCPHDYAVSLSTTLVAQQSWWSYDPQPKLIEQAPVGITILRPIQVLTLRVPNVEADAQDLIDVNETAYGRTNKEIFLGKPKGFWLLEDFQARQLYGDHGLFGSTGAIIKGHYEILMVLKGDPWRHHERWQINWPAGVQVIPPPPGEEGPPEKIEGLVPIIPASNSFEDMRAAHLALAVFPQSEVPFRKLVPKDVEQCVVEELSKP